jgi:hypothetical protein
MPVTCWTLVTIATCATQARRAAASTYEALPNERPATRALAMAQMAAESEPFQDLQAALVTYFNGNIDAALIEDEPAALTEAGRIVAEHLGAARVQLARPAPIIDWTDEGAVSDAALAMTRRAGLMRFVRMLDV